MQIRNSLLRAVAYLRSPERTARILLPIISAIPIAALFDAANIMKTWEEPLVRIVAHNQNPKGSPVAVIALDDYDLQTEFGGKRPLDPSKLGTIVEAAIGLGAKAVAVDYVTADPSYEALSKRSWGAPVIWGRPGKYSYRAEKFYVEDALGDAGTSPSGVPVLPVDDDGVIRRYPRKVKTERGYFWNLPVALLIQGGMPHAGDDGDQRLIRYYGHTSGWHRVHYAARKDPEGKERTSEGILDLYEDEDMRRQQALKGKVVFVGVTFRGVDEHQTPLGYMNGVEILAQIAETDAINSKPLHQARLRIVILAGAFAIAICFASLRFRTAVLVSICGTAALPLLVAMITRSVRDPLIVLAVFLAIMMQQIYSKLRDMWKPRAAPVHCTDPEHCEYAASAGRNS